MLDLSVLTGLLKPAGLLIGDTGANGTPRQEARRPAQGRIPGTGAKSAAGRDAAIGHSGTAGRYASDEGTVARGFCPPAQQGAARHG